MVELVDSVDLGSTAKSVQVRVLLPAPIKQGTPCGCPALLVVEDGLEPIKMRQSGGLPSSSTVGAGLLSRETWVTHREETWVTVYGCGVR